MSAGLGNCSKIRHIVRLRQMLRRWRNKARLSANRIPSDVPAGHVAVCVGSSCRRFVVRATHLNHPIFKKLLVQAEEEYGFNNQGPLAIPCDESLFEEVLRFISRSESGKHGNNPTRFVNLEDFQRYCHVGIRNNLDFWPESRPLLHGIADKTIWQVHCQCIKFGFVDDVSVGTALVNTYMKTENVGDERRVFDEMKCGVLDFIALLLCME
ncbi:hypothetical protein SO802_004091 [Lithocarpus litseifolius]|uniref:Uncharacterized protein n=1 Tax=Lithocarpus litseifolius TaxID=425828 RepID=A0AAW2E2J0_9ROSI